MLFRIVSLAAALSIVVVAQEAPQDAFEKRIRPVLAAHCYSCHSASLTAPQAGLTLDSVRGIRQGGNSGAAIQPGDPERSLLLRALRHTDKNLKMPPGKPLAPEVVAEFENWIRAGAPMSADQPKVDKNQTSLWSLKSRHCRRYPPCANSGGFATTSIVSS